MNLFLFKKLLYVLAFAIPWISAHDMNGMDMSMDGAMQLTIGQMLNYFHFTPGDNLWFLGWVPVSTGAMVGACIGLFLLAVIERWIAACRAGMERHWRDRAMVEYANRMNVPTLPSNGKDERKTLQTSSHCKPTLSQILTMRAAVPFIPAHDIMRGVMQIGQSALGFAFMLAVMTFQLGFILAIVIGLGVGETLFGRYIHVGGAGPVGGH